MLTHPLTDPLLQIWRPATASLLRRIFFVIIVPLVLVDGLNLAHAQFWLLLNTNLFLLILTSIVILGPGLSITTRSLALISFVLVTSLFGIATFGLFGAYLAGVITSVVLALLMLPRRTLTILLTLGGSALLLLIAGFGLGLFQVPAAHLAYFTHPGVLLVHGLLIVCGLVTLVVALSSLLNMLHQSLQQTHASLTAQAQLSAQLDATVEQRTNELRQTTTLLAATQSLAQVGGIAFDADRNVISWSDELYHIYAIPPGQPINTPLIEQLHPDQSWQMLNEALDQLVTHGLAYDLELPGRTLDGRSLWVRITGAPDHTFPGRFIGAVQVITARKQAELSLAAELYMSETLARCSQLLLTEGADKRPWPATVQPVLAVLRPRLHCAQLLLCFETTSNDGSTNRVTVHDAAPEAPPITLGSLRVTDLPPHLVAKLRSGMSVELDPQELKLTDRSTLALAPLLAHGIVLNGQLRGIVLACEPEQQTWSPRSIRLLQSGLEQLVAFLQRWETATTLRFAEAQLRAVGDNLPNGFIYQIRRDEQWRPHFTYMSSGVERVLGITAEAILRDADTLHQMIVPEDYQRNRQLAREQAIVNADFKAVTRHRLADGTIRWIYLCSRPRQHPQGGTIWDGVALDITEQQQAAEALAQARDAAEAAARAKSAFLAAMSHEIRTPLHAVIGMSELLLETDLTDEQQACASTIRRGGAALLAVINDILDFSRIESGKLELESTAFDLRSCLSGTIDLVSHSAHRQGITLHWHCAEQVPHEVIGDSARLAQVLLNLLGNAIKFTPQGEVRLEVSVAFQQANPEPTALIQFAVRDTGIGMNETQIERLFTPFVQADSSITRRYGGTGLGLSISKQLVELMGGTISVNSSPGQGATFTVNLPMRYRTEHLHPEAATPPSAHGTRLRILVAEDNPVNQEVVKHMLQRLGYAPDLVNDGQAALESVQQTAYDLVLMDVQMPIMDGEQATRRIRAELPTERQPLIVALSASPYTEDRERARAAGMDDYLLKPLQLNTLRSLLQTLTARSQAEPTSAEDSSPTSVRPAQSSLPTLPSSSPPPVLVTWNMLDEQASRLGADGKATISLLRQLFTELVPTQLDTLAEALNQQDRSQFRLILAQLRSACAQLGATAMLAACDELAQHEQPTDAKLALERLQLCFRATAAQLNQANSA
ncbi:MAG: ATP-binding protein [Oscillochloridaceae bacterium umkhey_bin13]